MRSKGNLAGPLHGLPVSLKDTYQVVGTHATIGAVAYLDRKSEENSALVDMLLDLGAVIYVKTNVAQVLMVCLMGVSLLGVVFRWKPTNKPKRAWSPIITSSAVS